MYAIWFNGVRNTLWAGGYLCSNGKISMNMYEIAYFDSQKDAWDYVRSKGKMADDVRKVC